MRKLESDWPDAIPLSSFDVCVCVLCCAVLCRYGVYLENQVPNHLWSSFVVSSKEDRDLLTRETKRNNMRVSIYFSPHAAEPIQHPDGNAQDYKRQFGIVHTLDEVFDAPLAVKNVMADMAGINRVYVPFLSCHSPRGSSLSFSVNEVRRPGRTRM